MIHNISPCLTNSISSPSCGGDQAHKLQQRIQRKEATRDFIKIMATQYPEEGYNVAEIEKDIVELKNELELCLGCVKSSAGGLGAGASGTAGASVGGSAVVLSFAAADGPPRWERKNAVGDTWMAYDAGISAKMEEHFLRHERTVDVEPPGTYCDLKRLYQARWDGGGARLPIRRVPAAESGTLIDEWKIMHSEHTNLDLMFD